MYEQFTLYGCNIGAVSPWKGLRRRRPWLARYRWFCVVRFWREEGCVHGFCMENTPLPAQCQLEPTLPVTTRQKTCVDGKAAKWRG